MPNIANSIERYLDDNMPPSRTTTEFTREDACSPAFPHLIALIENRLSNHRLANDAVMTPDETARLRGRISECKEITDLLKRIMADHRGPAAR